MTDIEALQDSIKALSLAKNVKVGKLKAAVKDTMERRHTQRESQRRPT